VELLLTFGGVILTFFSYFLWFCIGIYTSEAKSLFRSSNHL
jgi:hypothetical protein